MLRVISSLALLASLLHSAAAIAEDAKTGPVRDPSIADLVEPTESLYTGEWRYEMDDLDFQDNSPLGRIKRIRRLPLLTLVETRHSTIFLGVDSKGILGLHINAR